MTWRVGSIGVRPARTMKVRNADNSAIATANGATHFRRIPPPDSASDGSNDGAEVVSAVVIPAISNMKGLVPAIRGLMHSYHNVAELRQFRGRPTAKAIDPQLRHPPLLRREASSIPSRRSGRPECRDP